jgi:hypothetical protein
VAGVASENVAVVEVVLEALNAGDIDRVLEQVDPAEFELDFSRSINPDQKGIYRGSGVEISQQPFSVYRFRDSKVVELRVYADRVPALDSMHG